MVAISLYRGKLHRIPPDVPRRWLMPARGISLQDFRILMRRRAKALYLDDSGRLIEAGNLEAPAGGAELKAQSNVSNSATSDGAKGGVTGNGVIGLSRDAVVAGDEAPRGHEQARPSVPLQGEKSKLPDGANEGEVGDAVRSGSTEPQEGKAGGSLEPQKEVNTIRCAASNKEKLKMEMEEKLHTLNERKHQLVQVLKQILKAEEEMKKRSSIQGLGGRDTEGGESEDFGNSRASYLQHVPGTSPSAASPLGRPVVTPFQYNPFSHTGRVGHILAHGQATSGMTLGMIASPSRFSSHQGLPPSLPPLSVSSTHFAASSPSPATSGGTSVFRDGRLTSPSSNP